MLDDPNLHFAYTKKSFKKRLFGCLLCHSGCLKKLKKKKRKEMENRKDLLLQTREIKEFKNFKGNFVHLQKYRVGLQRIWSFCRQYSFSNKKVFERVGIS